jgi:hypothetical protein
MRSALRALTLVAIATGAVLAPSAGAAGELIQPGAYSQSGDAACTLNFVYDGTGPVAGRTFIGTAAHCVSAVGDDVALSSGEAFGDVAVIGNADTTQPDWALIEIRPEFLNRVSAGVKGHPEYPTGVTTPQDTAEGDLVQLSGYGLGFDMVDVTQEQRVAVMGYDDDELYDVVGPIDFGDSGGPLVHVASGKALGIVSRLCVGVCTEEGATVQGVLAKAAEAGFPITLRTV